MWHVPAFLQGALRQGLGAWHRWPTKAPLQLRQTRQSGYSHLRPGQPPHHSALASAGAPPRAGGSSGGRGMFWDQTEGVFAQQRERAKHHRRTHFKVVNFIFNEFHLNKKKMIMLIGATGWRPERTARPSLSFKTLARVCASASASP